MKLIQFQNYLRKICQIKSDDRIVVGVSGGADSICLLDMLQKLGNPLLVVYFNHHLRPESDEELKFVRQIAQSQGLDFFQGEGDVKDFAQKHHKTIEEAARIFRYEFLFKQAHENNMQAVAVGHTANDQVETILMHILRGCGLDGLQGMLPLTTTAFYPEIKLIRPLLLFWKEEILEYCSKNKLEHIEDNSNQNPQFFRNRLRHELIPTLRKYNSNVEKHIINLGVIANRDLYLNNQLASIDYQNCLIEESTAYLAFSISKFLGCSENSKRRVLQKAFKKLNKSPSEISFDHLERMVDFIQSPGSKSHLPMISNYEISLEGDFLYINKNTAELPFYNWPYVEKASVISIDRPGTTTINHDWKVNTELIQSSNIVYPHFSGQLIFQAYIDAEKIHGQLLIECQKPGDRYFPLGLKGASQKLSDFWVNKKIPRRLRATWPLIKCKNEIIWIPGFQPSSICQVTEKTSQILRIEMIKKK